jgi:hypothetical protein
LNSIGFDADTTKIRRPTISKTIVAWDTRFAQLEEYKKVHGDCNVVQRTSSDSQSIELGRWVSVQRYKKKKLLMRQQCEEKLNAIGFVWTTRCQADWNVRFQQLLEYKETFGDCHVPQTFRSNPQLGRWVQTQRVVNKNKTLTKARKEQLDSIGFVWEKQHCGWIARNKQLEDEHGRTPHELTPHRTGAVVAYHPTYTSWRLHILSIMGKRKLF